MHMRSDAASEPPKAQQQPQFDCGAKEKVGDTTYVSVRPEQHCASFASLKVQPDTHLVADEADRVGAHREGSLRVELVGHGQVGILRAVLNKLTALDVLTDVKGPVALDAEEADRRAGRILGEARVRGGAPQRAGRVDCVNLSLALRVHLLLRARGEGEREGGDVQPASWVMWGRQSPA